MRPISRTTKVLAGTAIVAAVLSPLVNWLLQKSGESPNSKLTAQASEIPKPLGNGPGVDNSNPTSAQKLAVVSPASKSEKDQNPVASIHDAKDGSTHNAKAPEKGTAAHSDISTSPDEIAKTKDLILKKQDAWIEKHPGIVSRYKAGKTDKAEIELAINELEIIERLAADIRDHRSEQWADQQKLQLQMIDVAYVRQGR